jgi:hypothetical protein
LSSGSSDDESYSKSSSAQTKLSSSPFRTVQGQRVNKANKRKLSSSESEKQVSSESASMVSYKAYTNGKFLLENQLGHFPFVVKYAYFARLRQISFYVFRHGLQSNEQDNQ